MREDPWGCLTGSVKLFLAMLVVMLAVSCYDTPFRLIDEDQAGIDPNLVGDWIVRDEEKPEDDGTALLVRQFNNNQYYIEWGQGEGDDSLRLAGFVAQVGGRWFLQARSIEPDAEKSYLLVLIGWQDENPYFRHLSAAFMKTQDILSHDDLRRVVQENANNDEMYDGARQMLTPKPKPDDPTRDATDEG